MKDKEGNRDTKIQILPSIARNINGGNVGVGSHYYRM